MAAKSYLHLPAVFPVGIRRNNPGNLRKGKQVPYPGLTDRPDTGRGPQFYAFESMAYGVRAMLTLLLSRIKKGATTINKLAANYAPPSENNTAQWIAQVSKYAGIKPTATLGTDKATMKKLALGIMKKETGLVWNKNGVKATIDGDDFEDAWALLQGPAVA